MNALHTPAGICGTPDGEWLPEAVCCDWQTGHDAAAYLRANGYVVDRVVNGPWTSTNRYAVTTCGWSLGWNGRVERVG